MRGRSFSAIEQEIEFENTPTQFLQYELSAHGLLQSVNNVDGLDIFITSTLAVFRRNSDFFSLVLVLLADWFDFCRRTGMGAG